MSGRWDDSLGIFVSESPQDFISWVLKGAVFKEKLQTKFKTRTMDADEVLLVELENRKRMLVHFEFQSYWDPTMPERMLEYNVEAKREHRLPVYSCLMYLRDVGEIPPPPLRWELPTGEVVLDFYYRCIELAKVSTQEFRGLGLPGLAPLMILTKDGAKREIAEEIIGGLVAKEQRGLLQVTKLLGDSLK